VQHEDTLTVLHTLVLIKGPPAAYIRSPFKEKPNVWPTIIPRNPLAPPPLSAAFLQISFSADVVNFISTPEYPKSAVYWDISEPRTSVKMRRKSGTVSGESVVNDGRRDMNSGINLKVVSDDIKAVSMFLIHTHILPNLSKDVISK
jgi:hypothetical protein